MGQEDTIQNNKKTASGLSLVISLMNCMFWILLAWHFFNFSFNDKHGIWNCCTNNLII